jgi:formic-like protein
LLSEEDKFLMRLALVERLPAKLSCINYIVNFDDQLSSLELQLSTISSAALSLKSSQKFQTLLEIILTFGNYMNGGFVYGFRLKGTLEKLTGTRSNDKQQTLLQYIVTEVIVQHFPHLLSLDTELVCLNEAARISMKNVATEVESIECGWRRIKCENQLSMCSVLRAFVENANEKCNKLMNDFEIVQNNYRECCAFFGENYEKIDSDEFFTVVRKFIVEYVGAQSF